MKAVGIIPARYGSTRFEGKPLVDICGKSMIRRVYDQASQAIDVVYVATDDQRIVDEVLSFNGKVVMTSIDHETGSNRCLEASKMIQKEFDHDIIINIQGDEPLLEPENLKTLVGLFQEIDVDFATLIRKMHSDEPLKSGNGVYVTMNERNEAMYFSRSVIPFIRDFAQEDWKAQHRYYKHIGVYGYTTTALERFSSMSKSNLEIAENLEQLRWIENGGKIKLAEVEDNGMAVDTREDLEKVIKHITG